MNRKNIGALIGFMVLFSMCLVPSILLLNQKTIINNYYGDNETDSELNITYTESTIIFLNLTGNPEWFYDVSYDLINDYRVFFEANITDANIPFYCYIIPDYLFEIWNESGRDNYYQTYLKSFTGKFTHFNVWSIESSGIWYFCWEVNDYYSVGVNITIKMVYPLIN